LIFVLPFKRIEHRLPLALGLALLRRSRLKVQRPKWPPHFLPKGSHAAPADLASKDAALIAAFKRKGFTDVVLRTAVTL
jgi:hypothetical protein